MKFCAKCGNELADDAQVCMNCGCAAGTQKGNTIAAKTNKISGKKKIVFIVITAVLAMALLVGAYFLVNYIRAVNVVNDLSDRRFTYYDYSSYSFTEKEMDFDSEGNLTYSYYYSNVMDAPEEYERDYQIKFKKGMTFLVAGIDEYEIQYDKYGKINGIYNIDLDELFD